MAKIYYTDINLNGNQIKNVKLEKRSTDPDPSEALIYYNDDVKSIRFHNGTEWITVGDSDEPTIDIDRDVTRDFEDLFGRNIYDEITGTSVVSLSEFIEHAFYPAIPAAISIQMQGSGYVELGAPTDFFDKTFTALITLNDWNNSGGNFHYYSDFEIGLNGQTIPNYPTVNQEKSEIISFSSILGTYQTFATVKVTIDAVEHNLTSGSIYFRIVLPWFYGVNSNNSLSGSNLYNAFTSDLIPFTTKVLDYSFSNGDYLYFCIPTNWGKKVSTIVDNAGSGDDVTSAFITDDDPGISLADITRAVTRATKWTEDYYVYVTRNPQSEGEQSLQFNLTNV